RAHQFRAPLARTRTAARHVGLDPLDQLRVALAPTLLGDVLFAGVVESGERLRDATTHEGLAGESVVGLAEARRGGATARLAGLVLRGATPYAGGAGRAGVEVQLADFAVDGVECAIQFIESATLGIAE